MEELRNRARNVIFVYNFSSVFHLVSHSGATLFVLKYPKRSESRGGFLDLAVVFLLSILFCMNFLRNRRNYCKVMIMEVIALLLIVVGYTALTIFVVTKSREPVRLNKRDANHYSESYNTEISTISNIQVDDFCKSEFEFCTNVEVSTVPPTEIDKSYDMIVKHIDPIESFSFSMAVKILNVGRRYLKHIKIDVTLESVDERSATSSELSIEKRLYITSDEIFSIILPGLVSVVMHIIKLSLLVSYKSIITKIQHLQQIDGQQIDEIQMVELPNPGNQN